MNAPTKLPAAPPLLLIETPPMQASKGELVPVVSMDDLVSAARQAHAEAEAASLTAVMKGIEVGKTLTAIKAKLPHGSFEEFVAARFTFTMRYAQNYMKMARQEPKLRELLAAKASLRSHLTMREALTFLRTMGEKRKRKTNGTKQRPPPSGPAD